MTGRHEVFWKVEGGFLTWYSRDGEEEKTEVGVELQPGAYHSSGFLLCFRSIRLIAIEREREKMI